MNRVAAVLFDFGGTLDHDGRDWCARLYEAVRRRGAAEEAPEFEQQVSAAAGAMDGLADTRQLTMAATVERLCRLVHQRRGGGAQWDPAEVAREFVAESLGYLRRNRAVLAELAGQYRLGVISNNWGNTRGWCEEYGFSAYLEAIIDSAAVGAAKPARAIFAAALTALGLPAEACVYVGDRYESDVLGARAAGLGAIWITGADGRDGPDADAALGRIRRLTDLPGVLRARLTLSAPQPSESRRDEAG